MQTQPLSAVLPVTPQHSVPAGNPGDNDAAAPTTRFSNVLTNEHAKKASANGRHGQTDHADVDRKNPPAGPADTADADDEALAHAAAEQGMTLPQIALNIAAEVAAVRQSGLAAALKGHGAVSTAADPAQDIRQLPSRLPLMTDTAVARATATQDAKVDASTGLLSDTLNSGKPAAQAAIDTPLRSLASQQAPLGSGMAARIAGAKQAVQTMQARMQAGDGKHQPKVGASLPEVFTPLLASVDPASDTVVARASPDMNALQAAATTPPAGSMTGLLMPSFGPGAGPQAQLPTIAAPLHSPQWASELGRQFVSFTQGGHNMPHTAELRLDPPELGPLRISINLNDNVAHAVFMSSHASVRQSVENALPQLQQMLAQAGISLGQASVNDQGQPNQAFDDHPGQERGRAVDANAAGAGTVTMASSPVVRSPAPDALVDTFA